MKPRLVILDVDDNRYPSLRVFLQHGPHVQVDDSDLICPRPRWENYMSKVADFLSDPMNAPCLDGPFDYFWRKVLYQVPTPPIDRDKRFNAKQPYMWKRMARKVTVAVLILYWITHITAALGLLLISDPYDQSHNTLNKMYVKKKIGLRQLSLRTN